jgi:hypothetical protein
MANLGTVFKIPTKAQIGFLKLDASLSENHVRSAEVTENEVEDGVVISDHVRLSPRTLNIEGFISSVPVSVLGLGVSTDDILGTAKDFLQSNESSGFTGLVKNAVRTPKEAYDYLDDLMEKRIPFSVVTALKRYENMIITNLSAPRSASNGDSLYFNIELKQIKIVKSSVVLIPAFKTTSIGAVSKSKLGKQSTQIANQVQTDNSSLLLKASKWVGGQ